MSDVFKKFDQSILITLGQPRSVDTVPFPAVTFLEPFIFDEKFLNDDFYYSRRFKEERPILFKFLKDNNLVNIFFTKVQVCFVRAFFYEYPFKNYENEIVPTLRNISSDDSFSKQEALWNSKYETTFVKRLTEQGFGYSFNILNANDILNFDK
jgi:hypothetical protein